MSHCKLCGRTVSVSAGTSINTLERDAALARLAQAERSAVSWQEEARAAYLKRDELRGHYDAVRKQVIAVTERLAAARTAQTRAETAILEYGRWVRVTFPPSLEQSDAEQVLLDLADVLAAPPCASCGQDPAGGHNLGCPDGAGLG